MKKSLIYIISGLAVFLCLLFFIKDKDYKPPVDWTATYSRFDKNPYGCYILYQEWHQLFPGTKLEPIQKSIYDLLYEYEYYEEEEDEYYDEYYEESYNQNTLSSIVDKWYNSFEKNDQLFKDQLSELRQQNHEAISNDKPKNFIFISEMCSLNDRDARELLKHMIKGNTVLMSATSFAMEFPFLSELVCKKRIETALDSTYLSFTDGKKYRYKKQSVSSFFDYTSNENIEELATNNDGKPVLLKVNYGRGHLLLSSTPLAFTNYNMLLEDNNNYVSGTLKNLYLQDSWWCGNYLEYDYEADFDGSSIKTEDDRSIMQFIHSQPPLTWAFYVLLGALIIFFALAIKRKQREIPPYKQPANTSVEFTNTISRLYLRQNDHGDIGKKMITYFFEEIRSKYYLNPHQPSADFESKLSEKSGADIDDVKATFKCIAIFKEKKTITEQDVATLNKQIQNFKNKCR